MSKRRPADRPLLASRFWRKVSRQVLGHTSIQNRLFFRFTVLGTQQNTRGIEFIRSKDTLLKKSATLSPFSMVDTKITWRWTYMLLIHEAVRTPKKLGLGQCNVRK